VASNERYLIARGLPANANVMWLTSSAAGSIALPGAGQGVLCLGLPLVREIATTDARGEALASAPFHSTAGTRYYQVWYRDHDSVTGAVTSRVSDAVVVELR
jgi:hypothetical protein